MLIMSFKRRKFDSHPIRIDEPFKTTVLTPVESSSGSTVFSVVDVPVSEIGSSIPNVQDYTLEKLINANVPLNPVSVQVNGFVPSDDADNFVEKFVDSQTN